MRNTVSHSVTSKNDKYTLKSLERACMLLRMFTLDCPVLGITELSRKSNLNKSVVFRVMMTLEKASIVIKSETTRKYTLGIELFRLGNIVTSQMELKKNALPFMKELSKSCKETVVLYVLTEEDRICIEKVDSQHPVRRYVEVGEISPLYCGAAGKLLLSHLSESRKTEYFNKNLLEQLAPRTITSNSELKDQLVDIAEKGYAISIEERVHDSTSLAVPVRGYSGKVIAALAILGPISRLQPEEILNYLPMTIEAADKVSKSLGYGSN